MGDPTATPRAGWFPDPSGVPGRKWWDGVNWSNELPPPKKRGVPFIASLALSIAALILGIVIGVSGKPDTNAAAPAQNTPASAVQTSPQKTEPSPPARGIVTLSGDGEMNTSKVAMKGDYSATWQTFGDCYYSAFLKTGENSSEPVFTASNALTGTSNVYGLIASDYYLYVITGPAPDCRWTVSFTPPP